MEHCGGDRGCVGHCRQSGCMKCYCGAAWEQPDQHMDTTHHSIPSHKPHAAGSPEHALSHNPFPNPYRLQAMPTLPPQGLQQHRPSFLPLPPLYPAGPCSQTTALDQGSVHMIFPGPSATHTPTVSLAHSLTSGSLGANPMAGVQPNRWHPKYPVSPRWTEPESQVPEAPAWACDLGLW